MKNQKHYKSNFLKKVILRLDFEKIELGSLEEFYDKDLKKMFPKKDIKKGQEGTVKLDFSSGDVSQIKNEFNVFSFQSKDNKKRFEVSEKHAFIEYDKYSSSDELFKDAKKIVERFINILKVKTINRLGLRFINEINLKQKNPLNWESYMNINLLGGINFVDHKKEKISRSMSQLVFKNDKGDLTFNYGIFNKEFPNEVVTKEFILDFDCYSLLPFETTDEEIMDRIEKYHSYIEDLFEKCIKDDFRKILNKTKK